MSFLDGQWTSQTSMKMSNHCMETFVYRWRIEINWTSNRAEMTVLWTVVTRIYVSVAFAHTTWKSWMDCVVIWIDAKVRGIDLWIISRQETMNDRETDIKFFLWKYPNKKKLSWSFSSNLIWRQIRQRSAWRRRELIWMESTLRSHYRSVKISIKKYEKEDSWERHLN